MIDRLLDVLSPSLSIGFALFIGYWVGSRSNTFLNQLDKVRTFTASNILDLEKQLNQLNSRVSHLEAILLESLKDK